MKNVDSVGWGEDLYDRLYSENMNYVGVPEHKYEMGDQITGFGGCYVQGLVKIHFIRASSEADAIAFHRR